MTPIKAPTLNDFFDSIATECDGFQFGSPCRVDEESLSVVLPILRLNHDRREYITFPESNAVQVSDSGSINVVEAQNNGTEPVFIRSGTIFKGQATQSRAITRSMIIKPGEKVGMDARCVHQSHYIAKGNEFKYSGTIPLNMENRVYDENFRPLGQQQYWQEVRNSSAQMMAYTASHGASNESLNSSLRERLTRMASRPVDHYRPGSFTSVRDILGNHLGSDSLVQNYDDFSKSFDEVLSKVRIREKQSGLALITMRGVETIECFDVPLSWESMHKDAVKRMGAELVTKDPESVFEMKPEKAKQMVVNVLQRHWDSEKVYYHRGDDKLKVFAIKSPPYIGEVVEFRGTVMHMMIFKRAA